MKAAVLGDYDSLDGLVIDDRPVPTPGDDQILVKVAAASVNPVDWKVRDGMLRAGMKLALPLILGGDIAGVVTDRGRTAQDFEIGQAVHAMTDTSFRYAHGAFAQYVAVRSAQAAHKPATLDMAEAAAVPLAALTAWQALFDEGGLRAGQRVLIHAAAGGVGGFAVQFARIAGAHVIGTASAANADYVRALGAQEVIDYAAALFEDRVRDVDLVIDLIGGEVQLRSLRVLRPGGMLVNGWGALAEAEARAAGVKARKVAVRPDGDQLGQIDAMIDAGQVSVELAHRFPLTEIEQAFALSRRGHGRGKIVLEMPA